MVQKKKKNTVQSDAVTEKSATSTQSKTNTPARGWKHPYIWATVIGLSIAFAFISIDFLPRVYKQFHPTEPEKNPNTVVATIDGQDIRLSDVTKFAETMPQLAGVPFEVIYPRLLDSLINMRVIANAAEKSGIEKKDVVQQALKNARQQILSQAYLGDQLEKLMTEEKLREIYIQEIRKMPEQDEIKARHILVKTKEAAEKIAQQLKDGADFAKLSAKESLANENGGNLGYFTKQMMIPEFGDVVFKMNKGDISKPIQTPMGWHVVVVDDKRPAPTPTFDSVQEELQQIFAAQNLQNILMQERQKQNVKVIQPAY